MVSEHEPRERRFVPGSWDRSVPRPPVEGQEQGLQVTMNHAHASLLDLLAASLCSMMLLATGINFFLNEGEPLLGMMVMLLAICIVASWIVIQVKGRE